MKDLFNPLRAEVKSPELHGHAKITLTSPDGSTEVIEHDNIVTDTIQNIFKSNMNGKLDYFKLIPLLKLFNGCALYNTNITETAATMCNIPQGAEEVAHAGADPYSGLDTTAGNPNELESGKITNGYKWVWDWGTSQGNGTLNCVSLTSSRAGFAGRNSVDPTKSSFDILSDEISSQDKDGVYGKNLFFKCPLFDWEGDRAYEVNIADDSNTLNIKEYGFGGLTINLFDDLLYDETSKYNEYNFTLAQKPADHYSIQLLGRVVYLAWVKSANSIHLVTIDLDAGSVNERDLSWSGASFQQSFYSNYPVYKWKVNLLPIVGNYIYIPKNDQKTFYKCNLNVLADIVELPTKLTHPAYIFETRTDFSSTSYGAVILENGNLLYNSCSIINDEVIPTKSFSDERGSSFSNIFGGGCRLLPGVYLVHSEPAYDNRRFGYICLTSESITTINLLKEPINKTADKTMKLEYSITMTEV